MRGGYLIAAAVLAMTALVLVVCRRLLGQLSPLPQEGLTSRREGESDRPGPPVPAFASDPWLPYAGTVGKAKEGYIVDVLRNIYEPLGHQVR